MFALFVIYKDGRKEQVGTFADLNETYDRYIKDVRDGAGMDRFAEVVNTSTNNIVERYF